MYTVSDMNVTVSYLELTRPPTASEERPCPERITPEKLGLDEYLNLYMLVGESVRWDQRLHMPRAELAGLLVSARRPIWLHTDSWDHPAAIKLYQSAGFQIYLTRDEPPEICNDRR